MHHGLDRPAAPLPVIPTIRRFMAGEHLTAAEWDVVNHILDNNLAQQLGDLLLGAPPAPPPPVPDNVVRLPVRTKRLGDAA